MRLADLIVSTAVLEGEPSMSKEALIAFLLRKATYPSKASRPYFMRSSAASGWLQTASEVGSLSHMRNIRLFRSGWRSWPCAGRPVTQPSFR